MLEPAVLEYCRNDVVDIRGFERSEFVRAEKGRFEMRAFPAKDCENSIGTVHGGFLLALADMAGTGVADTYGFENATMALNANFLRPARIDDAYLDVVATVVHAGRRSVVSDVVIMRPGGEAVLKATCTVALFDTRIGACDAAADADAADARAAV